MFSISFLLLVFSFVMHAEAVPRRLNPQCRSNVCDDRPVCPSKSCRSLFPSRMDCAVYYQCVNGKPFQYRCSPGLLFNNETLTCDYSYNVNCSLTTNAPYSTQTINVSSTVFLPMTEKEPKTITTNVTKREFTSTQEATEVTSKSMSSEIPTTEEEFTSSATTEVSTTTKLVTEDDQTETTQKPTTDRTTIKTTFKIPSTIMSTFESIPTKITRETSDRLISNTTQEFSTVVTTQNSSTTETPVTETVTAEIIDKTSMGEETTKIPTTTPKSFTVVTTEKEFLTTILTASSTLKPSTDSSFSTKNNLITNATYTSTEEEFLTTMLTSSSTLTPSTDSSFSTENNLITNATYTSTEEEFLTTMLTSSSTLTPSTDSSFSTENNLITNATYTSTEEEFLTSMLTSSSTLTPSTDSSFSTENNLITNATYTSTENNPTSTSKYPSSEFLCPERFGLFADPKSCYRFYHCSHWKPYHKWCPSNLHFNPTLRVCDWPYRAGCDRVHNKVLDKKTVKKSGLVEPDSALPTAYEPEGPSASLDPDIGNATCDCDYCELPVLGDCTAYILCIDHVSNYMHCGSNLAFNPMTATCDFPENVHCPKEDFQCPESPGRYTLEGSCSYFIECRNGNKTMKKCPEGLQFNQSSEMCGWLGSCTGHPDGVVSSKIVADNAICNGCDYCFKPYASDCARYIRCSRNLTTEERCSSGLLFNPATEMCDHDSNVQCPSSESQPECPEPSGYFPYPGECGKYLHCINGSATEKNCPGVLHFDPVEKHCDWPWAAGCNDSNSRPSTNSSLDIVDCDCDCCLKPVGTDCRRFIICVNQEGFEGSCSSGLLYNSQTENCDFAENVDCPVTPEIPDYQCPEHQGLFPHPEDCEKFIHCAHGFPYVKDCPSHLHFNPKLKVCDWPYAAGCQGNPTVEPPVDNNDLPCDICDTCFIPDESDCTSYIYCRNGTGYRLRCTENLVFNPETETCDETSNVKCPGQPPSQCPKADGLFPAKECSQFIHCSNGIAYLKNCPDGLHFNAQILVCDWPENVTCGEMPMQPTLPPPDVDDTDTRNITCNCDCCYFPHHKDCSKYILCLDGIKYVGQCSRGLLFNSALQNCDLAERVTCEEESPLCPESNGLFPNPEECSSFLKCSDGVAKVETCQNGTHFSPDKKQCLEPCKAQCDNSYDCFTNPGIVTSTHGPSICSEPDGFYPVANDCTSFYVCSDGHAEVVKCPSGLHYNSYFEICEEPCEAKCDPNINCGSSSPTSSSALPTSPSTISSSTTLSPYCPEKDGLFPNDEDCASFYQCSAGRAYRVQCPSGLHFSSKDKVCEYPCDAKCNASIDCGSSSPTSSSALPTSPSAISSTTLSPYCPEKDGLFPNDEDCASFYQCSAGRAYLVQCPSGLHFSNKDKVCEYPCDAKCNASIDCDSSSPIPSSAIPTSSSAITFSTTLSPYCPEKDGLFPNHEDCSSFYQCSAGRAYLVQCPSGLHFSNKDKVCEYPCDAKCNASIDCSSSSPTSISTTPSPHCLSPDGLYPVSGECTAFYLCSNGKEYLIHCPPDLHFSQLHETCEPPCDALCNTTFNCGTTVESLTSTPHPVSPECEEPDGLFPNPDDCGSFFQCSNGRSHLVRCPNDLHFSLEDSACERPCVAGCDISEECPPEIPEKKGNCSCNNCYLPDPTDCSAFYYCEKGELSKGYCPFGTLFDKISNVCDDENDVDCETNGDPSMCPEPYGFFPYPGDCKKFVHCDNSIAHVKECPADLEYDPYHRVCTKPKGNCGEIVLDPKCPEPTGMFPDPTDCGRFYHCEHGVAYPKQCSSPLMFNPHKEVCDWPENVDCGRDVTSNTTSPSISSTQTKSITSSIVTPSTSPTPEMSECEEVPGVICPCACRVPTYDECSSYFQCQEDGTACKRFCPEGLYFNKREMMCDLPENVECRDFFFTSMRRAKLFGHHSRS